MSEAHQIDLTGLEEWAAKRIANSPVDINEIWNDWTDNLPVAFSKRAAFFASTKQTLHAKGIRYSDKTIGMLTDALLVYFTMPGKSDLEHPHHGLYGWSPREKDIAA